MEATIHKHRIYQAEECTETPTRPEPLMQLTAGGQAERALTSPATDGRKLKVTGGGGLSQGRGERDNIKRPGFSFYF